MNYLDLLPDDVTKIVNRKVQDLHVIERRIKVALHAQETMAHSEITSILRGTPRPEIESRGRMPAQVATRLKRARYSTWLSARVSLDLGPLMRKR